MLPKNDRGEYIGEPIVSDKLFRYIISNSVYRNYFAKLPKNNVDRMLKKFKFPHSLMSFLSLDEREKFRRVSAFRIWKFPLLLLFSKLIGNGGAPGLFPELLQRSGR